MSASDHQRTVVLAGRVVTGLVVVVILTALVAVVGSPFEARMEKVDAQRAEDIAALAGAVQSFYADKHALPSDFSKLREWLPDQPKDPSTGASYFYDRQGKTHFRLGAVFQTDTTDRAARREVTGYGQGSREKVHKKGLVWFSYPAKGEGYRA